MASSHGVVALECLAEAVRLYLVGQDFPEQSSKLPKVLRDVRATPGGEVEAGVQVRSSVHLGNS